MPNVIRKMEEGGIIVVAAKFSKFLTGAASCNADRIEKLPYWADYPAFVPLFQSSKTLSLPLCKINCDQSVASTVTTAFPRGEVSASIFPSTGQDLLKFDNRTLPTGEAVQEKTRISADLNRSGRCPRILSRAWYSFTTSSKQQHHTVVPKKSVRVEPKSFFANERTFIQWVSGALLLVTVPAIILDFQSGQGASLTVGFCLITGGAVIVCYAVFVYFRRLRLLTSGSPCGYIDRVGPVIFAGSVLLDIVVLLVYDHDTAPGGRASTLAAGIKNAEVAIQHEAGVCTQHHLQAGHLSS